MLNLDNRMGQQPDLVCFSHLRWDFVYQRPQHLLTRCARDRRVFAEGALAAARWIVGRQGIFTMQDVIATSDSRTAEQR